jgi:hypothetical protein
MFVTLVLFICLGYVFRIRAINTTCDELTPEQQSQLEPVQETERSPVTTEREMIA